MSSGDRPQPSGGPAASPATARKAVLLRLDPAVHSALVRWATDDLRSLNAQIEAVLRDGLYRAGRLPSDLRPPGDGLLQAVPSETHLA